MVMIKLILFKDLNPVFFAILHCLKKSFASKS